MDTQSQSASRASVSSSSTRERRQQTPQQQVSQIEKSVTQLLVATKQLLETLTQWSRGTATETQVSDIYVRLGYEFNIACRAFGAIGVDTSDLGPVPELLRTILEETLSQEPSQSSLDRFLPRIRDIIINLLQGLKKKQTKLRQRNGRESQGPNGVAQRQNSAGSLPPDDDGTVRSSSKPQRQSSTDRVSQDSDHTSTRSQSTRSRRDSPGRPGSVQSSSGQPTLVSSYSSQQLPSLPTITSPPPDQATTFLAPDTPPSYSPGLPVPRPRPQDALTALQNGGELERRASRRYSAYQIQKHLGTSTSGISMIPPVQTPPIPNRGRDTRESINAVRVRGGIVPGRQRPMHSIPSESVGGQQVAQTILEDRSSSPPRADTASTSDASYSDQESTMQMDRQNGAPAKTEELPVMNATVTSPFANDMSMGDTDDLTPIHSMTHRNDSLSLRDPPVKSPLATEILPTTIEGGPQTNKELTLFLQYKSKIKKIVLANGLDELTMGRLQLAFIEKFAWNTHNNGVDLPEIYIQDQVSGVRHELEDLSDIKNRSVLVLNIDTLDEVKRHLDEGIGALRQIVEGVRTAVDDQQVTLQRVTERQQDTAKEVAKLASTPAAAPLPPSTSAATASTRSSELLMNGVISPTMSRATMAKLNEVSALRRDLAVIRQTTSRLFTDMETSMASIRAKAAAVKTISIKQSTPTFDSDSGRAYVNAGKKTLSEDSEKIVNTVDDLQDIVEDLRKDVVSRGVRPLPRQLDTVNKDISNATTQLRKLQEYLKREKPLWTKIWENELQVVCDDRDLLTMQEELAADLEDDLEKATQTFALVEQATKQQNLQSAQGNTSRSASRNMNPIDSTIDPQKAKDGVLGEVRALEPNHDSRLEAIERAEKARQRELASRREGEFGKELGSFVEEGKLKKSGGVEEIERLRRAKDDMIRKEVWERQNGIVSSESPDDVSRSPAGTTEEDAAKHVTESDDNAQSDPSRSLENSDGPQTASPEPEFVEARETTAPDDLPSAPKDI